MHEEKAEIQKITVAKCTVFVKNKLHFFFFLAMGPMTSEKGPTKIIKKLKRSKLSTCQTHASYKFIGV